jgi:hypothetical protein
MMCLFSERTDVVAIAMTDCGRVRIASAKDVILVSAALERPPATPRPWRTPREGISVPNYPWYHDSTTIASRAHIHPTVRFRNEVREFPESKILAIWDTFGDTAD